MNPVTILPGIIKAAKTINDISKQVKTNKKQCQSLSKRIECIVAVLEDRSVDDFNGTATERALQSLAETLDESAKFVQKFTDASDLGRFFNNSKHQKKFEMLNMHLSHNAADLKLALSVISIFDQHQDVTDRQTDLAEISSKFDDIALAMVEQQQTLLNQNKGMQDEFKRRFGSFKFHLEQDVLKAQNPVEAKTIEEESKLFLHIPYHDLVSEELIGQGGFADVYRGTWLSQRHRVAIKTIRITYLTDNVKKNFLDEITAMYKIRYDYVLGVFGACIEPNYYALVLEYMSLGSLFNVLREKKHLFSWDDRWSIALQMTKGVNYLHMISIIHRDIKSLNFLMDIAVDGYLVKISDFGLAKIRQETNRQTTEDVGHQQIGGTLQWKAPELMKFGKPLKASDIYSLGVVFWELATGCVPYDELDDATICQGVKDGERLQIPNDVPPTFASIISNAWSQEPSNRSTSQQLIQEITNSSLDKMETPKLLSTTVRIDDSSSIIPPNHLAQSPVTPMEDVLSKERHTYRNPEVERLIVQCHPCSVINLSEHQLTDRDMEIIVQQAIITKQCKNLWLEYNKITSEGALILSNALYNNTTLCELWLYKNHVSDVGVHYLSQALSNNETLKKVGLASNGITNLGVSYLVEMLKKNKTLITLGLAMNQIGDQGGQILANTLAHQNTTLQVLTIDRNELVTDLTVNSLVNMIKHNRSIKELWINGCNLSEKGKKKLREVTQSKKDFNLVTV